MTVKTNIFMQGQVPNPAVMKGLKKTFREMEIEDVVDIGATADLLKKDAEKVVEAAKEVIKDTGDGTVSGREYVASITSPSESFIDPKALFDLMLDEGFIKITQTKKGYKVEGRFFDLVKVQVTPTKAFMGEASLKPILVVRAGPPRLSFREA